MRTQKWLFWTAASLFIGIALLLVLHGPNDAQINLKTGALRYRIFRIPFFYDRLQQPYSRWLREISSAPDRWVTVQTYPNTCSNHSEIMCSGFYVQASAWVTVDQNIAKAVLGDVVRYILSTEARSGLPDSIFLLEKALRPEGQEIRIEPGWTSDPEIHDYLQKHNLSKDTNA